MATKGTRRYMAALGTFWAARHILWLEVGNRFFSRHKKNWFSSRHKKIVFLVDLTKIVQDSM
jgi:hypothetical protein